MAIDRIAVRGIHLRHKLFFLPGLIPEESFDLIPKILFPLFTVQAAVFSYDQRICLHNTAHGSGGLDSSLVRVALYQHTVKLRPLRSDRIALFFTAQEKSAALRICLNVVHQGIPAAKV